MVSTSTNTAYLVAMVILLVLATTAGFIWYRVYKNKKWGKQ